MVAKDNAWSKQVYCYLYLPFSKPAILSGVLLCFFASPKKLIYYRFYSTSEIHTATDLTRSFEAVSDIIFILLNAPRALHFAKWRHF